LIDLRLQSFHKHFAHTTIFFFFQICEAGVLGAIHKRM
jgi:hypothetical protein